jgi:hypothetical protein
MSVLLQLSDTHFGTEQGALVRPSVARHARSWRAWLRPCCWPFQAATTSRYSVCGRACADRKGGIAPC